MARFLRPWFLVVIVAGCSAAPTRTKSSDGAWQSNPRERELSSAADLEGAPSVTLVAPRTIGDATPRAAEDASSARPPVRRRIDVSFRRASLHDAVRLLAEAGRFAVVVGDGVSGQVDLELKNVEPYEALVTLATVKGAEVSYERRVVVVRAARKPL